MRKLLPLILAAMCLSACTGQDIRHYWDEREVSISDYSKSAEAFGEFAALAAKAPLSEAVQALETLYDRIQDKEVEYIIYSEFTETAFHNYYSPYRRPELFQAMVERIAADRILSKEDIARLQQMAENDRLNLPGAPCVLPGGLEAEGNALYLVLNLDCRTCLQSLNGLVNKYPKAKHIALCFGWGEVPKAEGWEFLHPQGIDKCFDSEAAPFWFLTDGAGRIKVPYCTEIEHESFATPQ